VFKFVLAFEIDGFASLQQQMHPQVQKNMINAIIPIITINIIPIIFPTTPPP